MPAGLWTPPPCLGSQRFFSFFFFSFFFLFPRSCPRRTNGFAICARTGGWAGLSGMRLHPRDPGQKCQPGGPLGGGQFFYLDGNLRPLVPPNRDLFLRGRAVRRSREPTHDLFVSLYSLQLSPSFRAPKNTSGLGLFGEFSLFFFYLLSSSWPSFRCLPNRASL